MNKDEKLIWESYSDSHQQDESLNNDDNINRLKNIIDQETDQAKKRDLEMVLRALMTLPGSKQQPPKQVVTQEQGLEDMSDDEIAAQDAQDAASLPESHIGYDAKQTCQEIMKAASERVGNKGVVYTVSGRDGTYGVFTNVNDARAIEEETRGTVYEVPLNQYLSGNDMPVEM